MSKTKRNTAKNDVRDDALQGRDNTPEPAHTFAARDLRSMGLPWSCANGHVVEDRGIDVDLDAGVEYRWLVFSSRIDGQTTVCGVHYSKPIGAAIGVNAFDPWKGEQEVEATILRARREGLMAVAAG